MDEQVAAMIDVLLNRIEHMEEMDELKELERLNVERSLLLQDIELCCRALEKTANLILKTTEMLSLLKVITQGVEEKQAATGRKWLAYWGIVEGDEKETEITYEMRQLS